MRRYIFFLYSIVSLVLLGIALVWVYPWFRNTFYPTFPEAEVQIYFVGVGIGTILLSLGFWIDGKIVVPDKRHQAVSKLPTSFIHPLVLLGVGVGVLWYFSRYVLSSLGFIRMMGEMGFVLPGAFDPLVYAGVAVGYSLLLPLVTGKGNGAAGDLRGAWWDRIAIGTIAVLAFHVGYLSIFDFTHYAGPINDLLRGHLPLASPSWYGFLAIVFLSFIFRVVPLGLFNLHIVFAVLVVLGFVVYYKLLCVLTGHRRGIALFVTVFAIFANWITVNSLRGTIPQSTVVRFGMWIPLAFAILYESESKEGAGSRGRRLVTLFVVVFSLFWTFDIGLYVLMSYLLFRWFSSLSSSVGVTVKHFIFQVAMTTGAVASGFVGIALLYLALWRQLPQWHNLWGNPMSYLVSPLVLPLPGTILPFLVLAPGVAAIVYVLDKKMKSTERLFPSDTLVLFIACYSVVQFVYFMGRSHPNNLHHVILPLVVCLFFLIHRGLVAGWRRGFSTGVAVTILISLLLAYPTTPLVLQGIVNLRRENILTTIQTLQHPQGTEEQFFGSTVQVISERYPKILAEHAFAIVSVYDTWYLVLLGATNVVGSNCLFCYITPDTVAPLIEQIRKDKPKVLFVDADRLLHIGEVSWIFTPVSPAYRFKESLGLLDVYERVDAQESL